MGKQNQNLLEGLADEWDSTKQLRKRVLKEKCVLKWPSPKMVGVLSLETLRENVDIMAPLLEMWCPQKPSPKTIRMDDAKIEAPITKYVFPKCIIHIIHYSITNPQPRSSDWQVRRFRSELRLSTQPSTVHCDAHAVRGFVSLMIHRNEEGERKDPNFELIQEFTVFILEPFNVFILEPS